jgi:hypothetical protein
MALVPSVCNFVCTWYFVYAYSMGNSMNHATIAAETHKKLVHLAFFVKRKLDRMNPDQQKQAIENIKTMFEYKE